MVSRPAGRKRGLFDRPRRRHHRDGAAPGQGRRRLDPRLDGDHRQIDRIADRLGRRRGCRIAGDDQRLGATPHKRPRNQHAALTQEGFGAVAIGQELRIGEIQEILARQAVEQGPQNRQAAKSGIKNADGMGDQLVSSDKWA